MSSSVVEAIDDLVRGDASKRTTVGAIANYLRVVNDINLSDDDVRRLIDELHASKRARVADAVVVAPVVVAAPVRPTLTRVTVSILLDVENGGAGAVRVLKVGASPSSVCVRVDGEFRGADADLPLHLFVQPR